MQRLQRYVTPSSQTSTRPPTTDVNKYPTPPSATASEDRGPGKLAGNDQIVDRQQPYVGSRSETAVPSQVPRESQRFGVESRGGTMLPDLSEDRGPGKLVGNDQIVDRQQPYAGSRSETAVPSQVPRENQRFGVESRGGTVPPDLSASWPTGQYQQQSIQQARYNAAAAAPYQHPMTSPHLSASVPANFSPRPSGQPQQASSRPARDDPDDRSRQLYTSVDRNGQYGGPRPISVDPRTAAQTRGYPEPHAGMFKVTPRHQGHWRQSSYDAAGDGRNGARDYSRPVSTSGGRTPTLPPNVVDPYQGVRPTRDDGRSYRSSASSSQPDLMRYLDPASNRFDTSRPAEEPVQRRPGEPHHSAAYQAYPAAPSHSRSASNPVMLRAQGSNASASAVDSLFAYHQKSTPNPAAAPSQPPESQYIPPPAAVQRVTMQAQGHGAAPVKPPRLASSPQSAAVHPYNYDRQDSDPQQRAEYAQQVCTVFHWHLYKSSNGGGAKRILGGV